MNAKATSGINLHRDRHFIPNYYDRIFRNSHSSAAYSTSHLSFRSRLSNSRPGLSSNRASSSVSFRTGPKIRAVSTGTDKAVSMEMETGQETFYDLLGISESGTLSEIKKAYKQLARKYHPDVSPPERTEEYTKKFILVREAYETLCDPQSRALYDRDIAPGLHLAFSARRRSCYDEGWVEKEEWRARWKTQLEELKRRSKNPDDSKRSWGAGMRRQRSDVYDFGFN